MDNRGYGMSSVRFICGTQDIHKQLEGAIADYFGTEDTILYAACFDANGGVFEPLLDERDAIISDALNHASIIDGVRLCKAVRYRYANADMDELERCLKLAQAQRFRVIVTDGVFSMDGNVAPMDRICALAERYDALVMVDECHSAGVVGPTGRGVTELFGLRGRVDIITGTLGKAFGGAIGGFTTGRREIVEMLRQRSRPYLFSNSLPPAVVGAGIEVFRMLSESDALHDRLTVNVERFRGRMLAAGFDIKPTQSAICAVMLYDAKLSQDFAARLLDEGIYVTGFYYPVVPQVQARIRVHHADCREAGRIIGCETVQLVVTNPPYTALGAGLVSPEETRALSRSDSDCPLADWMAACARVLQNGGRLCAVFPAPRFLALCDAMRGAKVEPKRVRFIVSRPENAPKLALVEGRKRGRPGLHLLPMLVTHTADGGFTEEMRRIYGEL